MFYIQIPKGINSIHITLQSENQIAFVVSGHVSSKALDLLQYATITYQCTKSIHPDQVSSFLHTDNSLWTSHQEAGNYVLIHRGPISHPTFIPHQTHPSLTSSFTLQQGIDADMYGENDSVCGNCAKSNHFCYYARFGHLPPLLVINLKRFVDASGRKIDDMVHYPLHQLQFQSEDEGDLSYDLICVVCHHGSAISGHYTSFCKYQQQWFLMNDEIVTPVKEESVVSPHAYVLFYRLNSTKSQTKPRFKNYSAASTIPGNKHVQDIQGFKSVSSADVSKQQRMKEFQALLRPFSWRKRDLEVTVSERRSLCTGEIVEIDSEDGQESRGWFIDKG